MSQSATRSLAAALCAALFAAAAPARALDDDALGFERTPPRLAFVDGEVSFLRLGADDWTPALVNTALASGDELYSGQSANLELQIGARAFVRAGENTQLGLTSLEPDFLQLRVTAGHLSLDLRSLKAGQTFEIDTPNAAFTVERSGYYRVEVAGETTTFTSRRGGRATVTPAVGDSAVIAASEQVVVSGTEAPQIASYAAPELDAWDRWNYARTDDQIDAVSARYVPSGVYGANDLDQHGDWRVVPSYGAVWVPRGVAVGWAPYSAGRWIYDPYYAWTWVDDAPWGWAPYHYGRWVRVSGYWGWCPGPIVAHPYYSPALVAFYGGGGFSVGVTLGTPRVGWVALGWGEPVVPWWGPAHYRSHARWAGWGGPRVVNKVVIKNKTVIKNSDINIYQNADVRGAVVGVDRDHFGRRSRENVSYTRLQADSLRPLRGDLGVKPDRSSLVAEDRAAKRPPRDAWQRSVVATREPRVEARPEFAARRGDAAKTRQGDAAKTRRGDAPEADARTLDATPPARVVQPPREGRRIETSKRPPFGTDSDRVRRVPPAAPRFERAAKSQETSPQPERSAARAPERTRSEGRAAPAAERTRSERRTAPAAEQPDAPRAARARAEAAPPASPEARSPRTPSTRSERTLRAEPPKTERAPSARAAQPERTNDAAQRQRAPRAARELPGEPANRVYQQRGDRGDASARQSERSARAPSQEGNRAAREQGRAESGEPRVQTQGGGGSNANGRGSSRRH